MKIYFKICFMAIAALCLSCSKVSVEDTGFLAVSSVLDESTIEIEATTKAGADEVFTVKVFDALQSLAGQFTLEPGVKSEPLELRKGVYSVEASRGENPVAAFDAPYYYAKGSFMVKSSTCTEANLVCRLANEKISVRITDNIKAAFPSFEVDFAPQQDSPEYLQYTYAEIEADRTGYLKASSRIYVTVKATNTDGESFSQVYTIGEVEPRMHLTFEFDVSSQYTDEGAGALILKLDRGYDDVEDEIFTDFSASSLAISETTGTPSPYLCLEGVQEFGKFTISSSATLRKIYLTHNNDVFYAKGYAPKNELISSSVVVDGMSLVKLSATSYELDMRSFFAEHLPYGTYNFTLSAIDAASDYVEFPVEVKVVPATDFATKDIAATCYTMTVKGAYYTENVPTGLVVKYKEQSSGEWSDFSALEFTGRDFTAKITGLKPNTFYQAVVASASEFNSEQALSVKTLPAEQPYNFSFDEWWKDGKVWYPTSGNGVEYWDSANAGATLLGGDSSTYPDENHVIKGKACCMQSIALVGVFAGGNVYSGKFVERNGTTAILDQGQPFTCRPKALKGYYDYAPVTIDKAKSPYTGLKGQTDQALIYAYLTDWSAPHRVTSGNESSYVDYWNDSSVIAVAEIIVTENTGGQYKAFVKDFVYKNDKTPTYLVVTCTSSRYADYFTGGVGSKLWVDEFEFVYE